jgi:hypothetical protein
MPEKVGARARGLIIRGRARVCGLLEGATKGPRPLRGAGRRSRRILFGRMRGGEATHPRNGLRRARQKAAAGRSPGPIVRRVGRLVQVARSSPPPRPAHCPGVVVSRSRRGRQRVRGRSFSPLPGQMVNRSLGAGVD